jgi:hypothetical protein
MTLEHDDVPEEMRPYLKEVNSLYDIFIQVMVYKELDSIGQLDRIERMKAYWFTFRGYLADVWFNWTTGTKMFKERPKELTFTARLIRHKKTGVGWQYGLAQWICEEMLNPKTPGGDHC